MAASTQGPQHLFLMISIKNILDKGILRKTSEYLDFCKDMVPGCIHF